MSDATNYRGLDGDRTVHVVAGQHHRFMLIPVMEEETEWLKAGAVLIGVESRVFGTPEKGVMERGASVHIHDAETRQEWLRFDCFDNQPHYHYILQAQQHNIVWGYDPVANGPIFDWTIQCLRHHLPAMLRRAGAEDLAGRVDGQGIGEAVLADLGRAMAAARERTFPGDDKIAASMAWYNRWKEIHPRFNTVVD